MKCEEKVEIETGSVLPGVSLSLLLALDPKCRHPSCLLSGSSQNIDSFLPSTPPPPPPPSHFLSTRHDRCQAVLSVDRRKHVKRKEKKIFFMGNRMWEKRLDGSTTTPTLCTYIYIYSRAISPSPSLSLSPIRIERRGTTGKARTSIPWKENYLYRHILPPFLPFGDENLGGGSSSSPVAAFPPLHNTSFSYFSNSLSLS